MNKKRRDRRGCTLKRGECQRKDGSYTYRIQVKGKSYEIRAKTLDELREKEKKLTVEIYQGSSVKNKSVTINDVFDKWIKNKRGIKLNTRANYIDMFDRNVRPTFGKLKIASVKGTDITQFYNSILDEGIMKKSTLERIHNVLFQVFDYAIEDEIIQVNVAHNKLRGLTIANELKEKEVPPLEVEEQTAFVDFLSNNSQYNHWAPVFTVMLGTGMRAGEISGLRWSDIDFENNIINVNHTLVYIKRDDSDLHYIVNSTKTKAGCRQLPLLPFVKEALLTEREYQKNLGIKCNINVDGYTDFVFVNKIGRPHHDRTLNKALDRIVKEYNSNESNQTKLPHISCHMLRHTYCTRLFEEGVNVKVVQTLMGHSSFNITMDIYTKVTKNKLNYDLVNVCLDYRTVTV